MEPRTLYQKIWDRHSVEVLPDGTTLLYIDRHLINEVTSPQAFEGLRVSGHRPRDPQAVLAVADHNVPTLGRDRLIADPASRDQVAALEANVAEFGIPYVPLNSRMQGIVHVIGPELGLTLPGTTIVCGDSHTSTHGAFGALAFGIGTSEVEHVLVTQTLRLRPSKAMLVHVSGDIGKGVTAKDLILAIIARIGTAGANGHVIEYAGETIRALDMAGRMTVCNMSIEAGARAGLIAPDQTTFDWLRGRPLAPRDAEFDRALKDWRSLASDEDAVFDTRIDIDASAIVPMITWGTSPETAVPVGAGVPADADPGMLDYMGLERGQPLVDLPIDVVFIGSCTNSRIEDLRAAASIVRGCRVACDVRALVVPGSGSVKAQAEREGLADTFRAAGFEWREAGCSMCLGMNPDRLAAGQRCASTSNRNFEGRQGPGGRTHLMSPLMAAAAAIHGRIVDVRGIIDGTL